MNSSKYIDIHCHSLVHDPRVLEILVLDPRTAHLLPPPTADYFCYGLHPWYVDELEVDTIESCLKSVLQHPGFFAFGEFGLDRVHEADWNKQIEVLNKQIELINHWHIPRLVIHCVKAYSDLLSELKKLEGHPKILFHDYNGNQEIAKQLLSHFDCYFSFGQKLFNEQTTAYKTFAFLPKERIFLETDDQTEFSIIQIYKKAAALLAIKEEDLKQQLYQNFARFSS